MVKRIKRFFNWVWYKIRTFCPWYKGLYRGKPWYTKVGIGLFSSVITLIIYLGAVDLNFLWLFGKSPGFTQIKNPTTSQASQIYSDDGTLIGKYFNENRTSVEFNEVNPQFWKALIDTEDERFYQHFGIDFQGLFGAVKDAIIGNDARGASTITQQLAKNMFRVRTRYSTGLLGSIPGLKILIMKSKEWIIALKLEMIYDKDEILTMYANTIDFGSNAFGIKTASKTYFNTTPDKLTVEQSAVLVGMLKATTTYNPISNPKNCLKRRNVVLQNMVTRGDLTAATFDTLKTKAIELKHTVETNYDGQALYFREAVANELNDWCEENGYDLYSDGLKIYTTINAKMQQYAEKAAIKQMKQVQKNFNNHWGKKEPWVDEKGNAIPNFIEDIATRLPVYKYLVSKYNNDIDSINHYLNLPHTVKLFDYEKGTIEKNMSTMDSIRYMVRFMHCALVAMEPQTGAIKAWVGDIDFKTWKYDKARAMRQPGSTFKLFVYTEAMNQGLTPCDKRRDEYFSMKVFDKQKNQEVNWTPTNANGYFTGDSIPLKSAFARSINSIAVRLGQEMGIERIAETAHIMGIKSQLDIQPSLALGSSDVNLLEIVNAYSTVANDGKHNASMLVAKIVDKDGKVVYQAQPQNQQVIPYKSAFFMQQLLLGGLREPGGTSMSFGRYVGKFNDTEWGGKTGTSNNHSDAWFVGVSPNLVVGSWVGGEYRSIHFRTGALGQGSRTALPICGYFVEAVLNDPQFRKYRTKFGKPKDNNITTSMYMCDSYREKAKEDTTKTDSLVSESDEVILDEFGNPISIPHGNDTPQHAVDSNKLKEKKTPIEEIVNLDNL